MKKIFILTMYIVLSYIHASDNKYIYSEVTFNDYLHGNLNDNNIKAEMWMITSGLNFGGESYDIKLNTQSSLYDFYYTNIDTTNLILDLNSGVINADENIHALNFDFQQKYFALGLILGDKTMFYGDVRLHILPSMIMGLNMKQQSNNYLDLELFDTYTVSLDNKITELGMYITQTLGGLFWSIDTKFQSITSNSYEDKIQARYELSNIPDFSGTLSYNFNPLEVSLGFHYSYLEPFELTLYHNDVWFGSMDIEEESQFFNITTNLSSGMFQFDIGYDYYSIGAGRAQVETKAFLFGPLAYKKFVFELPEITLQKVSGAVSWSLFGLHIKTIYNRFLLENRDINWIYYNFMWSGLLPKVTYASQLESYSFSYDHLNTIELNIGYQRDFMEKFNISFNINQLIPFLDIDTDNITDNLENIDNLGGDRSTGDNIDGGRSYTLNISMKL